MTLVTSTHLVPETPTDQDRALARQAGPRLAVLAQQGQPLEVRLGQAGPVLLPAASAQLLARVLTLLGEGQAVAVLPVEAELTTGQAADLLHVSRPYLAKLLDDGRLPHRKVGPRRRVLLRDVLAYKEREAQARRKVLDELAAQAQELHLGY